MDLVPLKFHRVSPVSNYGEDFFFFFLSVNKRQRRRLSAVSSRLRAPSIVPPEPLSRRAQKQTVHTKQRRESGGDRLRNAKPRSEDKSSDSMR